MGEKITASTAAVPPTMEAFNALKLTLHTRESELKRLQQELQFAQTMQARFLSTVSHELRTPLHTLLGYVRLALGASSGEVHTLLEVAERSGRQLASQVSDLLRFSPRSESMARISPSLVCLPDLLAQLGHSAGLMSRAGINRFHSYVDADLPPWVNTDGARIVQVLENLLGNAFKYCQEADVTLHVQLSAADVSGMPQDCCMVEFSVRDTGPGIPAQELPRIFDPFVRSTQSHFVPGQGLGLAIAREWVRALGGDIAVESVVGVGSCFGFVLALPLPSGTGRPERHSVASQVGRLFSPSHRAPTVMVVDDAEENRMLLRRFCERWGCHVVEAASGIQALNYREHAGMPIDAYILDQCMPQMDGWALLQRLRDATAARPVPIAMVSASPATRPGDCPALCKPDLFLEKPLDPGLLRSFLASRLHAFPQVEGRGAQSGIAISVQAITRDEREHLRQLLHMGRVVRIAQWSRQQLAASQAPGAGPVAVREAETAERARFCQRTVDLAESADLVGLGRLLNTPDSPG